MHQFDETARQGCPLFPAHPGLPQAKLNVALHIQPGKERGLLEKQDAIRAGASYRLTTGIDGASGGRFKPGDNAQQGRFAAAAGAEQANELSGSHIHTDRLQGLDSPGASGEYLADALDLQRDTARRRLLFPVALFHTFGITDCDLTKHVLYPSSRLVYTVKLALPALWPGDSRQSF